MPRITRTIGSLSVLGVLVLCLSSSTARAGDPYTEALQFAVDAVRAHNKMPPSNEPLSPTLARGQCGPATNAMRWHLLEKGGVDGSQVYRINTNTFHPNGNGHSFIIRVAKDGTMRAYDPTYTQYEGLKSSTWEVTDESLQAHLRATGADPELTKGLTAKGLLEKGGSTAQDCSGWHHPVSRGNNARALEDLREYSRTKDPAAELEAARRKALPQSTGNPPGNGGAAGAGASGTGGEALAAVGGAGAIDATIIVAGTADKWGPAVAGGAPTCATGAAAFIGSPAFATIAPIGGVVIFAAAVGLPGVVEARRRADEVNRIDKEVRVPQMQRAIDAQTFGARGNPANPILPKPRVQTDEGEEDVAESAMQGLARMQQKNPVHARAMAMAIDPRLRGKSDAEVDRWIKNCQPR